MNAKISSKEKGQSLVLIAVLIIFFFGLLGLALDGGNAYAMKRAAQNAADSGALAGAATLCNSEDTRDPQTVAKSYVNKNNAEMVGFAIDNKVVTVTASISFNTFFLNFFGMSQMTAGAIAAAGCFSPGYGQGVLPVAWSCRPPAIDGSVPANPDETCVDKKITWAKLQQYLNTPDVIQPELYIVMDDFTYTAQQNANASPADFYCKEDYPDYGQLTCDIDGDHISDFFGGGGRSWLDLDGQFGKSYYGVPNPDCDQTSSEGAQELDYWITNGYECDLQTHTWLGEETGNVTSLYTAVEDRIQRNEDDRLVLLPVFDSFCTGADPRNDCVDSWHSQDLVYVSQPTYFHIKAFSAFWITCVNQGNIHLDPDHHDPNACPGIEAWAEKNAALFGWNNNVNINSIEGYFLTGIIPGLGGHPGDGVDTGVYTVYLIR